MKNGNDSKQAVSFFKDANGNTAVWQKPNIPLVGWALFQLLSMIVNSSSLKSWFTNLSMAFLFTWAYLEITSGSSYFRRALGAVVIIAVIIGFYKQT